MSFLLSAERTAAEAIAAIGYTNPFLPERIALERQALGAEFLASHPVLHWRPLQPFEPAYPNFPKLRAKAEQLADDLRLRLLAGADATERDLRTYQDLVLYMLYSRYMPRFDDDIGTPSERQRSARVTAIWRLFLVDFQHYLQLPERSLPTQYDPALVYSVLFQLHRAFKNIFDCIVGSSMPIARLRAAVWQSIFSHDMRRYGRTLYKYLGDVPTLILGPSGTGKELVARAIGYSRYVPFDVQQEAFSQNDVADFHALNLSALAASLIESELFGHRKGAFSGATADRVGWLETCGTTGTVFLDEIGELDPLLQVKLLRVLQTREFHRVGETTPRLFRGKIVAATNRDLALEINAGRFRDDLYYRLCADIIQTPPLKAQLADHPDDLGTLVAYLAQRIIHDEPEEAAALTSEVVNWITANLGDDYAWPGNIRELEQCARNIMIRGNYTPSLSRASSAIGSAREQLARLVTSGRLTMDELMQQYASLAFALDGSYVAAAKRLQINWRTLRDKVQPDLVDAFRPDTGNSEEHFVPDEPEPTS